MIEPAARPDRADTPSIAEASAAPRPRSETALPAAPQSVPRPAPGAAKNPGPAKNPGSAADPGPAADPGSAENTAEAITAPLPPVPASPSPPQHTAETEQIEQTGRTRQAAHTAQATSAAHTAHTGTAASAQGSRRKVKKHRTFEQHPRHAGAAHLRAPHGAAARTGRHATGGARPAQNLAGHKHELRRQATARRRSRSALLALVVILGIIVAAVTVTGTFVAGSMRERIARFPSPLLIYPVAQVTAGECVAGTKGVTGHSTNGPYCYQVTDGLAIRRVTDIHVQRGSDGAHQVSISLLPADRQAFADLTRKSVGRELAFVVRGRLLTAPRVEMPVTKGRIIIAGTFTQQAAERLVQELKGT